jgi:hypothetical protein
MVKLNIDEIQDVLHSFFKEEDMKIHVDLADAFYNKIREIEEEKENNKVEKKKSKKEWLIIVDEDDSHFVVQLGDDEEGNTVSDVTKAFSDAAELYNETEKGIKKPAFNTERVVEVAGKMLKDKGVYVKCKHSVPILKITSNDL